MRKLSGIVAAIVVVALMPSTAHAVALGTIDTFEGGTTQGWGAGIIIPPALAPTVVATGGPLGAGDAFLRVTGSGGSGPGSRLTTLNTAQWAGDYLAAGISSIEMDVKNLGATALTIRLIFDATPGGALDQRSTTTFGAVLPAQSDWIHVIFPIGAADLTANLGTAVGALSNASILRITHTAVADGDADPIAATLGIDNIATPRAVAEPGVLVPIALTLLLLAVMSGNRRTGAPKRAVL
jgi:hypothetical protein